MIPTLLWHQTPKHVHFQIELKNIQDEVFTFQNNHFTFQGKSQGKEYQIDFQLFSEVEEKECAYAVNDNNIKVIMTKKEISDWTSLQKDKSLFKNNIKVNWDLWDESDDEEQQIKQNFNYGNIMQTLNGVDDIRNKDPEDFEEESEDDVEDENSGCSSGCCSSNKECSQEKYSLNEYLKSLNSEGSPECCMGESPSCCVRNGPECCLGDGPECCVGECPPCCVKK